LKQRKQMERAFLVEPRLPQLEAGLRTKGLLDGAAMVGTSDPDEGSGGGETSCDSSDDDY
jgi:hypothetical protein